MSESRMIFVKLSGFRGKSICERHKKIKAFIRESLQIRMLLKLYNLDCML